MAIIPPQFLSPDGTSASALLTMVTSVRRQSLRGTLPSDVVDVQVRVNGGAFASDPSLVSFDQEGFEVPNPAVYPEGLLLAYGANTVEVRAVDVTGAVSPIAVASLDVVRGRDIGFAAQVPTGLRLRRRSGAVEIVWAQNDMPYTVGYHVYAAAQSGGGEEGYVRLNRRPIVDVSFQEESLREAGTFDVFYASAGGQLRVLLVEEDFNDVPVKQVADQVLDTALLGGQDVRVRTVLDGVRTTRYLSFVHDRLATVESGVINNEAFALLPADQPVYYVVTAVVYDPVSGREIESNYSAELAGMPLVLSTALREMPVRTQDDIVRDYLQSVIRVDNRVTGIPGSVVRDIFMEPPASEMERLHFIAGFIRRSQSFATLLEIDDLDGDGQSDPVSANPYKRAMLTAFGLSADADVQSLIDDGFDKLAANVQVMRGGQEFAVGQVTFYTAREPQEDVVVPEGTLVATESGTQAASATFSTTARVTIPYANRASFYNVQQKRWEVTAPIRAFDAGLAGNVAASTITRLLGGASGLQVVNLQATRFGRDKESNASLASRAILAFSSVDAGTEGGYLATALRQQGVFRARVVKAGDAMMMRDYDEARHRHVGGKVDVWVQGRDEVAVADSFALGFDVATNQRFVLASDPARLTFVVQDARVTPQNPIVEMLGVTADQRARGYGFRNATTGQEFILTNYAILDYNKIQLSAAAGQPPVGPNDVIVGDYRYRGTATYAFSRQPVLSISSLRSVNTDTILTDGVHYRLYRSADPLLEGQSTRAHDYMTLQPSGGLPTGEVFVVNDERHVLIGEIPESLGNLGANPLSVRVFSLDRTRAFAGPTSASPDFLLQLGSDTQPTRLVRVPGGAIGNGEEVSVDYEHDENFEVAYTVDQLVGRVQSALDVQRHVTADVLAKGAVPNPVNLEATVVLQASASRPRVDAQIRTALSQVFNAKPIGEAIYQSDVVHAIEGVDGVIYVVVPFAKMAMADGALIVREALNSEARIMGRMGGVKVYALQDALRYGTQNGGGPEQSPKGVFENDLPLAMAATYESLFARPGQALVVGGDGIVILGYSDDATLVAQGYGTPQARLAQRLSLTANRVFVSLAGDDVPAGRAYSATYACFGDRGAKSILVQEVAYVQLGNLTLTYQQR